MPFHPPPNWPTPPPGWEPGPDWTPDPSWPPAPPGWQFWSDAKPVDTAATAQIRLRAPGLDADPAATTRIPRSAADPSATARIIRPPVHPAEPSATARIAAPPPPAGPSAAIPSAPVLPPLQPHPVAAGPRSWQRGTARAATLINPIRLGYSAAAVLGGTLFCWLFALLRFTPQWNYQGWLWNGGWPVAGMIAALTIAVIGAIGVRRWDHQRWHRRRAASS